MNQTEKDADIPVLTDIINDDALAGTVAKLSLQARLQIEAALSDKLIGQLSQHIPLLLESALREPLTAAIETRLHSAIMAALATALPAAVQSATGELAAQLAMELGTRLHHHLETAVRGSVAEEVARLEI